MRQYIDLTRSQKLKDGIDNSFSAWQEDKTNPLIAGSVLTDLSLPFYVKDRGAISPQVVDYALVRLIEYLNLVVENNVAFPSSQHTRIMVLLCTMEGWKVFARERADYLLASLILTTPAKHERRDLDVTLFKTLFEWSGCALDAHSYTWEACNSEVTAAKFREHVGRYLFGDAWYTLYNDSLTGSFKEAYVAIQSTRPAFVSRVDHARSSRVPSVDVPHDF